MSKQEKATHADSDSDEEEYTNEDGLIPTPGPNINNNGQRNLNRHQLPLSPYDPKIPHRVVKPGLNFQGRCQNPKCKFKSQMVWWNVGYGCRQYAKELYASKCPICKEKLKPNTVTNIGYSLAKVKFTGLKKVGEDTEYVEFTDVQKRGQLVKFTGGNRSDTAQWIYLDIDVQQL